MKYMIAVETIQCVEVESETTEAAIEQVKSQMDPRVAAAAGFRVVTELVFDEASQSYTILFEQN
jgi:hypothetical protein